MQPGTYISGAAHAALIAWVLFGGVFQKTSASRIPENMNVSVISAAELAAMGARQPDTATAPNAPQAPAQEAAPQTPTAEPPIQTPAKPAAKAPPTADASPDVTQIEPLPQTEVTQTAPAAPPSPDTQTSAQLIVKTPQPPQPRAAPRVAPKAAAAPPKDAQLSDTAQKEVAPDPLAADKTPQKPSPAKAPAEASTQIVTEAEKPKAPIKSPRPKTRPSTPAAPKVAAKAAKPQKPDIKPDTKSATDSAVAAALAATAPAPAGAAPAGPPLTGGEKEALRVAVQACWNVGSLSSDALATTVVVGVSMNRDGTPDAGSIRMLSSDGGSASAAKQAYEAARRAIIRCGASGYNLPVEKFGRWQDIEMTFNPDKMRIK